MPLAALGVDGGLSDLQRSNCQRLWISSCSNSLVVQVDEPFEGAQAGMQAGVRGRGGGEQQHLGRRVIRGVEVVFFAVVAGDGVGPDLDPSVEAAGEVVNASVIAVALSELLQRCSSRVRTALAIDVMRLGLQRDLRKIRQDFRRATWRTMRLPLARGDPAGSKFRSASRRSCRSGTGQRHVQPVDRPLSDPGQGGLARPWRAPAADRDPDICQGRNVPGPPYSSRRRLGVPSTATAAEAGAVTASVRSQQWPTTPRHSAPLRKPSAPGPREKTCTASDGSSA